MSDLKDHAVNSTYDFYELLGIPSAASESEIRRAYRKTALKYHPDKVGADQEKLDTFHLLQIANDVLLDSAVRQLYDNARKAREEKKLRESAYGDRRKQLIDELERRERAGVAGVKRAREETDEEEAFQRELKRLAADGARRRKEREEQLRREYEEQLALEKRDSEPAAPVPSIATDSLQSLADIERTIKVRWPAEASIDQDGLRMRFSRFGEIQDIVTRDKKIKPEGQKHRKHYKVAMIVYESIVGAHTAILDVAELARKDHTWAAFEGLDWASGQQPDCIPKVKTRPNAPGQDKKVTSGDKPATANPESSQKAPSFSSFKGVSKSTSGASLEEITIMRLKQAERKRLAEKIRQEEEEEQKTEEVEAD